MASHNGHDYVEIGGLKWATMNVGASSVTDYGQYFQWGDTTGYLSGQCGSSGTTYAKPFNWADYKFGNGTASPNNSGLTKYNTSDTKAVLELSDDAARANWGGQWRMPTRNDIMALSNAVNVEWTSNYQDSGVNGFVCTDKTDSSKVLFFPLCKKCLNGTVTSYSNTQTMNALWSSSRFSSNSQTNSAYISLFYSGGLSSSNGDYRYLGLPVRGIVGE